MKKFIQITGIFLLSLFVISCNREHDHDDHDHDQIERVIVTVTNKANSNDVQTVNYVGGVADRNLTLVAGRNYAVSLDFQKKTSGGSYVSMNSEIITDKEEHFITYEFADAGITILRASDDTARVDGKKIGLKTDWAVSSVTSTSLVRIKLIHTPASVDDQFPTANNQLGRTVGGETDASLNINIR